MATDATPAVGLRLLGPLEITRLADGARIASSPRRAALLAYLAVAEPRGPQARDSLIALLWPESDATHGRRSLRNTLHELRQEVGVELIVTVGKHQVRLAREHLRCDLDDLEAALQAGDARRAVDRYGELMEGFHVRGADGFERWHEAARARLRTRVLTLARRAAGDLLDHAPAEGLDLVRAARRIDRDDAALLRLELEALGRLGDVTAVQRVFRHHEEQLARDEAGPPDPETTALVARLLERRPATATLTIALIPCDTDASRPEDAEFARALDDGVRRRLSRVAGVRVVARSTVQAAAGAGASALDVGRRCGATLVASGSLSTRAPDEVHVHLEILRSADGTLVRELQHRARRHDFFAVEGVVAAAIVPPRPEPASSPPLPDPQVPRTTETYLLCLRGQWHFLRAAHVGGKPEDLELSRGCFEEALARDPGCGAAYAGLSNYWAVCAARGLRTPFEETFGHAIALSHRALELDASLAVPHVHFGVRALYLERDWPTALAEFTEATRLDPGYAEAQRFRGIVQRALGHAPEGLAALHEAVRLDPQVPHFRNSLADALMGERQYDAAIAELEVALQLDPNFRGAMERLLRCLERAGRWEQALAARERLGEAGGAARFATAYRAAGADGYRAERQRELRALIASITARLDTAVPSPADRFAPPELALALAHAELGDWDAAWRWEQAASARGLRPWFSSHPDLAALASRR